MIEIAIGVAALVIGSIAGLALGRRLQRREQAREAREAARAMADKDEEIAVVETAREEAISAEVEQREQVEAERDRLRSELDEARSEALRYRQWAEGQVRLLADELAAEWEALSLPSRVHEISPVTTPSRDGVRSSALRLQEWMRELGTGAAEAHYQLGLHFVRENDLERAAESFGEASLKGMGVEGALALGDVLWALGKRDKAKEAYRQCLRSQNMPEHLYLRFAQTAVEKWQDKEAMTALDVLLRRRRNPPEVYSLASFACTRLGDDAKAIKICEKGLKAHRRHPLLLSRMIVPLQRLGETERAEEAYLRAAEAAPEMAEPPLAMGIARLETDQFGPAIKFLEDARQLAPEMAECSFYIGVAHNRQGRYRQALEHFRRAVELRPDYADAYYNMKDAYEGLKDFEGAIQALKKATRINPDYR